MSHTANQNYYEHIANALQQCTNAHEVDNLLKEMIKREEIPQEVWDMCESRRQEFCDECLGTGRDVGEDIRHPDDPTPTTEWDRECWKCKGTGEVIK